ncbi:peptide/nickel transport system ATP-binding protein [Streptomyces sp. 1114.5]|uniref:ABC transporter ATP-binding protein n=1 Tax=unclassified Streptomyces TaxID=2593676 RepID=UPI000BD741EA|nr:MULTISPECIES: ABC transporter ATP-binding protein [unclassified Streptomyces]RKT17046.1 peptide/nickel transport system ATP-binding protein [Streptomyces sp. 1114.5]SOB83257.1 peptide/nickel transport system ATP-binding protein [Streptomyces sp. 1331.2]
MIEISGLDLRAPDGRVVLDGLSLSVAAGERVGIVGESGSGKTTLAHAVLGSVRPGLRRAGGRVRLAGHDVLDLDPAALRSVRRRVVSYLPQDPPAHLTPTLRVGEQIAELADPAAGRDVAGHLERVGLPTDRAFQRRFPHQLSGGQQQRLALARALAPDPRVLVLDEPTTGLDMLTQRRVLDQIDELVTAQELTLLFITHDLTAVARMADRLVVMRDGAVVEDAPLARAFSAPAAPYTAELLSAAPVVSQLLDADAPPAAPPDAGRDRPPVLRVDGLRAGYGRRPSTDRSPGVSFEVAAGECVALLGLSGAGKTTLARCVSGHHRPDRGTVELHGEPLPAGLRARSVDQRRRVQLIAQDATLSLNPRRTVASALVRPLRRLHGLGREAAAAEADRLLALVDLDPALADRYPHQLSGGQRQRVAIARALAARPDVLICDEVTASLDVRVQAGVLDLLNGLRARLGLAVVFITHDLGVLARVADRVLVLVDGLVREEGPVATVLTDPQDEWTRSLVEAAPTLVPARGAVAAG